MPVYVCRALEYAGTGSGEQLRVVEHKHNHVQRNKHDHCDGVVVKLSHNGEYQHNELCEHVDTLVNNYEHTHDSEHEHDGIG